MEIDPNGGRLHWKIVIAVNKFWFETCFISLNKEITSESSLLTDLNERFESTRSRYLSQFTAMEQAVTSLKSTGEYLTNLFEAMNKD